MALFPQNPVAVVMQAAIPMDRDLVARGVAQHQLDGFGEVLVDGPVFRLARAIAGRKAGHGSDPVPCTCTPPEL